MYLHFCLFFFRQYQVTILWSIFGQTKFREDLLCLKQTWNLIMIDSHMLQDPVWLNPRSSSKVVRAGFEPYQWHTCTDQFLPIPSTKLIKQRLRSWNTNNETVSLFKHLFHPFSKKPLPSGLFKPSHVSSSSPPKQNTLPKTNTEPQYGSKWRFARFFFSEGWLSGSSLNFPREYLEQKNQYLEEFQGPGCKSKSSAFLLFPASNKRRNVANYWDVPRMDVIGVANTRGNLTNLTPPKKKHLTVLSIILGPVVSRNPCNGLLQLILT